MTHHTDAERADFEAWYIKCAQKAFPAFSAWSDIEVRDGCMRPDGKSYKIDTARIAWEAWQAARRAPAAPVPQFSRIAQKKLDYLLEAGEAITGYAIENKDGRRGAIDCHGFVYWWQDAAAPQPPANET